LDLHLHVLPHLQCAPISILVEHITSSASFCWCDCYRLSANLASSRSGSIRLLFFLDPMTSLLSHKSAVFFFLPPFRQRSDESSVLNLFPLLKDMLCALPFSRDAVIDFLSSNCYSLLLLVIYFPPTPPPFFRPSCIDLFASMSQFFPFARVSRTVSPMHNGTVALDTVTLSRSFPFLTPASLLFAPFI